MQGNLARRGAIGMTKSWTPVHGSVLTSTLTWLTPNPRRMQPAKHPRPIVAFALLHVRHQGLGHLEHAARVDGERLIPGFGGQFVDGRWPKYSRIVDEDVDVPETPDRFSHGSPAIGGVADVTQHRDAAAAKLLDLGNGLEEDLLLDSDVGQRQIVAAPRKTKRYRAANSAAFTVSSNDTRLAPEPSPVATIAAAAVASLAQSSKSQLRARPAMKPPV